MKRATTPNSDEDVHKFPILMSYAYLRNLKQKHLDKIFDNPLLEVLVDSGGFTAFYSKPVKLEAYMEFLAEYGKRLFGYFALDVIQKPKATRKNCERMWDAGLTPIPIHVWGESREYWEELYKHSDLLGFASKRHHREHPQVANYTIATKMKWAKGRKVHLLGIGSPRLIYHFRPYSCDSTSWKAGEEYGNCYLYLGRGRLITMNVKNRARRVNDPKVVQCIEEAGFNVDDVFKDELWRLNKKAGITSEKSVVTGLTAYSWVRFARDAKRILGVRVFLACQPRQNNFECVLKWVRETRERG